MVWIIIIFAVVVGLVFLKKKLRKDKVNHEVLYFGETGSGKTLTGVKESLKRLKINRKRVIKYNKSLKWKNFFRRLFKKDELFVKHLPVIYSNFPINSPYNILINRDMLLLKERLIEDSIVILDEFGSMASQFEFNDDELRVNIAEFTGKFRHYVGENALLVLIDQSPERILKEVKYSLGEIYELQNFKKILFFYLIRKIIYINFKQIDGIIDRANISIKFGLLPFKKLYESRYLKDRVKYIEKYEANYRNGEKLTIDVITRLGMEESNLDRIIKKNARKEMK